MRILGEVGIDAYCLVGGGHWILEALTFLDPAVLRSDAGRVPAWLVVLGLQKLSVSSTPWFPGL